MPKRYSPEEKSRILTRTAEISAAAAAPISATRARIWAFSSGVYLLGISFSPSLVLLFGVVIV